MQSQTVTRRRNPERTLAILSHIAMLPYLFCVAWITLLRRTPTVQRKNLTPFFEYTNVFYGERTLFFIGQIMGNLVMLLPLGMMLTFGWKPFRNPFLTVGAGFCCTTAIELTQWYTARGLLEWDDLFNNTVGAFIGYLLAMWILHICRSQKDTLC